jgi:hypothetical protein
MNMPEWMKVAVLALGRQPEEFQRQYEAVHYETVLTGQMLDRLFLGNLLNVELPEGPFNEGDELFVRGVRLKVKYVQNRRLVLELPPGRRFTRRWDWRRSREIGGDTDGR